MSVLRILDELEDLVATCAKIPMTGKILIDEEVLLEYFDRIRTGLPEELRQAKWLTKERQRVITEAQTEAERMLEETKQYVAKLANETEIVKEAENQREAILKDALREAEEMKLGAMNYADEVLGHLEQQLTRNLSTIKKGREELQMARSPRQNG